MKRYVICLSIIIIFSMLLMGTVASDIARASDVINIKMSYNGPPDIENNAVHAYAVNFKKYVEARTNGRITITLYPNSQLGNEEQRMEQVMNGPMINIASYGGISTIFPELFAASIPFMFDSYEAAHIFFDESQYWKEAKEEFRKRTGAVLLEAIEEGGFLAFTNSVREIRSPKDFAGLKFRAMDPSQVALYEAFGASGTPIPWTEVYMALKTGVADGQMNPPMYIIIGSLYEVQDYMTMANIQYSDQFLVINGDWFDSLSEEDREAIIKAAHDANVVNRIEVETQVAKRVNFIASQGVKVYYPNEEELNEFRELGQPAYINWLKDKIDQYWIDLALKCAEEANQEAAK